MAFNPAAFRANDGFVNPTLYGFSDRIHDLELRMFPFQEHALEAGDAETQRFLRLCHIQSAEELLSNNTVTREIIGITWATCLFSPYLSRESQRDAERFVPNRLLPGGGQGLDDIYDQYFNGVDGASPNSWLNHYMIKQLHTLIAHIYLNREKNIAAGFNTFLDVTPGSLFVKPVHVRTILDKIQIANPTSSFGDLHFSQRVRDIKVGICDRLLRQIGDDVYMPLWKIYVIFVYNIYRVIGGPSPRGFPCRIYLFRRLGRFLSRREDPARGQAADNAPAISGIGQYIRYFVWFQNPFQYFDKVYVPCQMNIFRDAHATGIHRVSNSVDREYFASCEGTGQRQVMIGMSPLYKCNRHAKLHDGERTMFNNQEGGAPGNIDTVNPERIGVLAGAVWSYNPRRDQALFGYDIFFLPFERLTDPIAGIRYPVNMPAEDQTWNIWGYGQDEYILSRLINLRATNPDVWDDANVLYYQLNWLGRVIGTDARRSEFYPETINAFRGIVGPREPAIRAAHAADPTPDEYFGDLIDEFEVNGRPITSRQSILEFMFGSINVDTYVQNPQIRVDIEAANQVNIAYRNDPQNFWCNVHSAFRLDRFDYWNNPGRRLPDRIHSNLQDVLANIRYCVQNKIGRDCGIGVRGCGDDVPDRQCRSVILGAAQGPIAPVGPVPPPPVGPAPPPPAPPGDVGGVDPDLLAAALEEERIFFGQVGPGVAAPAPRFDGLLNADPDDADFFRNPAAAVPAVPAAAPQPFLADLFRNPAAAQPLVPGQIQFAWAIGPQVQAPPQVGQDANAEALAILQGLQRPRLVGRQIPIPWWAPGAGQRPHMQPGR